MAARTKKKPEADEEEKKTNLPAVKDNANNLPVALADEMVGDSGAGLSDSQDDNIVPLLRILQDNSPQVKERDDAYIDGAKPGMILLRSSPSPLIDGEADGMWFQPCYFFKEVVEWIPRKNGGGLVARHAEWPDDTAEKEDDENPNRKKFYRTSNKNELVETRYHVGLVYRPDEPSAPYVMPLSGTGHTFSRQWMFMMNQRQIPGGKGRAPSYSSLYLIKTRPRSNAAGDWFMYEAVDVKWVDSKAMYDTGRALNQAFASGQKKVEDLDDEVAGPTGGGAGPGEEADGDIPF